MQTKLDHGQANQSCEEWKKLQEYGIVTHSRTYYCLLFSLCQMFIIFVISYQACTEIRVMLEHYHMSFLLTTEKGNLFYIQSCSRTKSCIRQTAFIPMFRTLSFKDSMTLFLFISNTLILGCGISGYDWTGTCLLWQYTNLPCFLLSSVSFLMVIEDPTEASGYFLLWSCINSEIVYKRPLVSPLVTVLQTQAQH